MVLAHSRHMVARVVFDQRIDTWAALHVEAFEELAGVSAEGLNVAALALGVERIEHQRTLARAAQPGDGDVATERQIEVEPLQVVLAHAAQADALGAGRRRMRNGGNHTLHEEQRAGKLNYAPPLARRSSAGCRR